MSFVKGLFTKTLNQARGGKSGDEADEKLSRLVAACRSTGKKGKIVVELTVTPDKCDGRYILADKITLKEPEFDRNDTWFWGTPDGNLIDRDPDQGTLDLKSVGTETGEMKFISEEEKTPKVV